MTARVMIALMLLVMQASAYLMGQGASFLVLDVCTLYLVATLAVRMLGRARPARPDLRSGSGSPPSRSMSIAFSALQFFQGGSVNYTALFAHAGPAGSGAGLAGAGAGNHRGRRAAAAG
jgi:two-component system sensor histidine kinase PilS (NtrC family)